MKRAWALFVGLMRELSDQNAYARHLAAHGVAARSSVKVMSVPADKVT